MNNQKEGRAYFQGWNSLVGTKKSLQNSNSETWKKQQQQQRNEKQKQFYNHQQIGWQGCDDMAGIHITRCAQDQPRLMQIT